jgi:eukaryotic-like serine/threonine-protein kinase
MAEKYDPAPEAPGAVGDARDSTKVDPLRRRLLLLDAAAVAVCLGAALLTHRSAAATPLDPGGWVARGLPPALLATAVLLTVRAAIVSTVISRLRRQARDGRQLGQYTLQARIGAGALGVVYRARHALLRRPTAIKLLLRAGGQALARFQREIEQTIRLSHPNTVAIHDYGQTAGGVFYCAMEYLDGLSLEELVGQDGPQPPGRVVHILRQACGALAEAHAAGLIHRDVKPANLHLCSRGGLADHLKVLDFGLVEDIDPGATGDLRGTPHYLAPETISRPESIDARADLYALGAVGYFLLTGTPPFRAGTLLELCGQHLHQAPQLPSERLGRDLPAALERLLLRCLAKSPDERPASASELARALGSCPGVWSWSEEDASRWWRARAPAVLEACARRRDAEATGPDEEAVAVDLRARLES